MNQRSADPSGDRRFTTRATMKHVWRLAGVNQFDLDPCADKFSCWAAVGMTKKENGLKQPWFGHVFVNPPWSNIGPWVKKSWEEMKPLDDKVDSVTMLLPDNRQSTAWWQKYVEPWRDRCFDCATHSPLLTTHYLPGRPRYGTPRDPNGAHSESPPWGAVVLRWTP